MPYREEIMTPNCIKVFKLICGTDEIILENYSMQDVLDYLNDNKDDKANEQKDQIRVLQQRNTELVEENRKLKQKLEEIRGMRSKLVKTKPGIII